MRQTLHTLLLLATLAIPVVAFNEFPAWFEAPVHQAVTAMSKDRTSIYLRGLKPTLPYTIPVGVPVRYCPENESLIIPTPDRAGSRAQVLGVTPCPSGTNSLQGGGTSNGADANAQRSSSPEPKPPGTSGKLLRSPQSMTEDAVNVGVTSVDRRPEESAPATGFSGSSAADLEWRKEQQSEQPDFSPTLPSVGHDSEGPSRQVPEESEPSPASVPRIGSSRVPAIARMHTLVGFLASPPCDDGNCFWLSTGEFVANMHLENFEEIVRRRGLTTIEIKRVDDGVCLIVDPVVPNEWLLKEPCDTCLPATVRDEILSKHGGSFRFLESQLGGSDRTDSQTSLRTWLRDKNQ